ncbi:hypothetical protein DY000_02051956 [Brassica cretica]|uniref:non-specific serine/threonine protein kinase n=1 Tax=Brassica cretica TaxID=69181 RepID=A0ABQ7AD32_BRACR|nr:hypothetical protein DY000_02051956 [Brassica cretica]
MSNLTGFISIDCGIPSGSSYTDDTTGINYVSDSSFVETGVSKSVSFTAQRQLQNLMSFSEGSRNCYTLIPKQGKGKKYLIRASFMYGNYDGENSSPEFDLFLGALTPTNATNPITMILENSDPTVRYFVYMHFAEVEDLSLTPDQTRVFHIRINGETIADFSPKYLQSDTLVLTPESQTDISQDDDDAVRSIKTSYNVKRNWQGDPCLPNSYIWEGLNCSDASLAPPRITLLNLSSSGLTGHISPSFSSLTMIEELDLSNNDLTGDIPESLSGLKFLRVLNLEKNKLTGSFPSDLLKRSKSGSLLLRVGDNPGLCTEVSCGKSNKKTLITAAGASLAALFILLLLSGVFWKIKKRSNKPVEEDTDSETRNRPKVDSNTLLFTFQDIVKMTNNFGRVLGKGGFGTVYHGYYNDLQVAVKLLSESSAQGFKEFRSEVEVLVRVHHVNLTALIGYFHESNQMGLVYEFMANGNMADHLSGKYEHSLAGHKDFRLHLMQHKGWSIFTVDANLR